MAVAERIGDVPANKRQNYVNWKSHFFFAGSLVNIYTVTRAIALTVWGVVGFVTAVFLSKRESNGNINIQPDRGRINHRRPLASD